MDCAWYGLTVRSSPERLRTVTGIYQASPPEGQFDLRRCIHKLCINKAQREYFLGQAHRPAVKHSRHNKTKDVVHLKFRLLLYLPASGQ